MAKVKQAAASAPTELRIGLFEPGMTPLLRAGLGGLAAALRTLPADLLADHGSWTIDQDAATLRWKRQGGATQFLKALFERCFRIDNQGLIDLTGTYEGGQPIGIRSALQDALRQTFLQHGQSTDKDGQPRAVSIEIDDQTQTLGLQSYKWFAHQDLWKELGAELDRTSPRPTELPGWANPGATERHVGLGVTKVEYTPAEGLCAAFALVGTISLHAPRAGVLVIPEPSDLVRFSVLRPRLTPRRLSDCYVSGPGDATLTMHAALRTNDFRRDSDAIRRVSATLLRSTAWASQQKSRVGVVRADRFPEDVLDTFEDLMGSLPARVVVAKPKKKGMPATFFGSTSSLRWLVAENLASGQKWFSGFATARVDDRFVHYFRARDNLGALWYPQDKKGLQIMLDHLAEAEGILVRSVHTALRQRYGAIWEENQGNSVAFHKRCNGEREKWRLAFAGAKTVEQVRHTFADLWSRAGTVRELQAGWSMVLPLLREERWHEARDLALVALASYEGRGGDQTVNAEESRNVEEQT